VPVLGSTSDALEAIETARADEVVVTIPDAPAERIALVTRACEAAGVPHRVARERPATVPTPAIAE